MTTLFYISGHGFGHASRDVEVINALGTQPDQRIVVRSAVSADLLQRTVNVPVELMAGPCDTGIVQVSSIAHDNSATVSAALDFYRDFPARVEAEVERLRGHRIDLIVGDVPPLAFAVAKRLSVPSVALANFTWDWIYEDHPGFVPAGTEVLELIRDCYGYATLALALPYAGGFDIFPTVEKIPMIARRATRTRADTRAFLGIPQDSRVAVLSFGGYGMPALDLTALDVTSDWTIVTTDRVSRPSHDLPHNIHVLKESAFLTRDFRYEDLIGAADVVMTKPGYGIITECLSTGAAMLYTSRGDFREYGVLVKALPDLLRSRFISPEDLLAGRWQAALDALLAQSPPPHPPATNGAAVVADILQRF